MVSVRIWVVHSEAQLLHTSYVNVLSHIMLRGSTVWCPWEWNQAFVICNFFVSFKLCRSTTYHRLTVAVIQVYFDDWQHYDYLWKYDNTVWKPWFVEFIVFETVFLNIVGVWARSPRTVCEDSWNILYIVSETNGCVTLPLETDYTDVYISIFRKTCARFSRQPHKLEDWVELESSGIKQLCLSQLPSHKLKFGWVWISKNRQRT